MPKLVQFITGPVSSERHKGKFEKVERFTTAKLRDTIMKIQRNALLSFGTGALTFVLCLVLIPEILLL